MSTCAPKKCCIMPLSSFSGAAVSKKQKTEYQQGGGSRMGSRQFDN
jgi:hypothetical protein